MDCVYLVHMMWLILCCLVSFEGIRPEVRMQEVCISEDFETSCGRDEVILMMSAEYGRMRKNRCIKSDRNIGCSNDVLGLLDRWCSGRRSCTVEASASDLEDMNIACEVDLKFYLTLSYECQKVAAECSTHTPTTLTHTTGYIASLVASETGCGSPRSPWVISLKDGQTVNISLTDFNVNDNDRQNYVTCKYVYGYILERALGINHTICGGARRQMALYSSKTNNVEIYLNARIDEKYFILKYEKIGCADIRRPVHAWYKREGNTAVIGCETNNQEWRLICTGNTWVGSYGNCSEKVDAGVSQPKKKKVPTATLR